MIHSTSAQSLYSVIFFNYIFVSSHFNIVLVCDILMFDCGNVISLIKGSIIDFISKANY